MVWHILIIYDCVIYWETKQLDNKGNLIYYFKEVKQKNNDKKIALDATHAYIIFCTTYLLFHVYIIVFNEII